GERRTHRYVDHRVFAMCAVVAKLRTRGGIELLSWLVGQNIDDAARRAAAVERAVWPAQHLDPVDSEEAQSHDQRARDRNDVTVDPYPGSALAPVISGGNTADIDSDAGRSGSHGHG